MKKRLDGPTILVRPKLFITVAYFQFKNLPWSTSNSAAKPQFFNFQIIFKKRRVFTPKSTNFMRFSSALQKKSSSRQIPQILCQLSNRLYYANGQYISSTKYPITQIALWPTTKFSYGPQVENHFTILRQIFLSILFIYFFICE